MQKIVFLSLKTTVFKVMKAIRYLLKSEHRRFYSSLKKTNETYHYPENFIRLKKTKLKRQLKTNVKNSIKFFEKEVTKQLKP